MNPLSTHVNRRAVLGLLTTAVFFPALIVKAESTGALPAMQVTHNRGCGCCAKWVAKMREAGFSVTLVEMNDMFEFKEKLGIPYKLSSCHTGQVAGYVIEGHVPPAAVMRLLAEKPAVTGLAVPGMPAGSPGMESPAPVDYDVIAFDGKTEKIFARYHGEKLL
jgi:hypothetical protein